MNDEQRRGLIEGLRLTREAIDKRLDELERRLERGDDVLGEARIRREELRAAKECVPASHSASAVEMVEIGMAWPHEELRAASRQNSTVEGYAGVCRGAGISPPLRTIDGYVAIDRWPPDGEGQ